MTLFDRYLVVDWSARNSPATGKDSIWIASLDRRGPVTFCNPPTRHAAEAHLASLLAAARDDRTLLAVDASLGYPAGSAAWFGLDGAPPWAAMWAWLDEAIVDDERNRNNRFEVAAALNRRHAPPLFWGRPSAIEVDGLSVTKPPPHPTVTEFRSCDRLLSANGYRPASPWQLLGAGSVGSQSLTLIPVLERLRRDRGAVVWPLSTGLRAPSTSAGGVVIVEIWPTFFPVEMPVHWVRDAAQVHGVARRIAAADRSGELRSWFEVAVGEQVELEEGWILGVEPGPVESSKNPSG